MQSFAFVIFGSMLFMNSAFAADSLISSHTTHPVLEALPSASPQASFQIAKTYYLPDYQQQINNVKGDSFTDRGNEDNTNRNDTCSSGGYYSSPLGSGYNCSRVVYAHQACYSCTAKSCPSGYTAGLTKCAAKTGYSASYSSNGISGTQTCGKCDYKELPCASGYSTSYQSVSNCGTTGSAGWTFTSNGYSGTKLCGKCTAKTCLSGYSTTYSDVSKCGSKGSKGWSWKKSSQYAGNSVCGKCAKLSCNSPYASGITSCSPSDGYALKQDSGRYNGDTVCGYCQPNNCSGTKQKDCNTSNGYTFTKTCKSGTTIYGTCTATPCPSGYSTAYQSVANCGSTGNSGWIFSSSGKSGGKICGKCTKRTCSGVTSVASCGTTGASGWTIGSKPSCYAGNTPYYTCSAKACASGTTYANRNCSANQIWTANSYYSGDDKCGTCVTTCQTTSCNQILIRATDDAAIMGLYMPAASTAAFCAGGSYFQSGNAHADINDNCGIKRCFGCDVNATYKTYFENAGSSSSGVEDSFNSCLRGCMWVTPPLAADKYVCYTMCNVAKQRWMLEHAGNNLSPQNQLFFCPYNLQLCCGSMSASTHSLYDRVINNTNFKAFSCNIIKETPSCRPSCSSW